MVAVFNKELLSWYLITLKLKETIDAGLQNDGSCLQEEGEGREEEEQRRLIQQPSEQLKVVVVDRGHQSASASASATPTTTGGGGWVDGMKERLEQARQDDASCCWGKLSIYRIPQSLRDAADDKAYVPQIVSLGPYHHGRTRLQEMERHKWRALLHMLKRTHHDVKLYLDSMKEVEERARLCYENCSSSSSSCRIGSNDFAEMMVLDGCFMLEIFRGTAEGFKKLGYARNDPVFSMRGTMHAIRRDMVMLENQIPLFVLDTLLSLQLGRPAEQLAGLVAKLALVFLDPLTPTDEPMTARDRNKLEMSTGHASCFDPLSSAPDHVGLHCLDVFRRSILRVGPQPTPKNWFRRWSHSNPIADKRRHQMIHSATDLKDAGVKFRRRKTDRFWDIKFKDGALNIPRLLVHDGTKSLFFNLIAFEQCHIDCTNDITSYMIFMDNLIDSAQDVSYLHSRRILEHWLGNDAEVADLFNRLCQEVVFDYNDSYLSHLSEDVNRYYNHRWNAWRATLSHRYFSNPWAIISFIAAVLLIFLTVAQTFYTIYAYYKPNT